jgi:hypothetical protein
MQYRQDVPIPWVQDSVVATDYYAGLRVGPSLSNSHSVITAAASGVISWTTYAASNADSPVAAQCVEYNQGRVGVGILPHDYRGHPNQAPPDLAVVMRHINFRGSDALGVDPFTYASDIGLPQVAEDISKGKALYVNCSPLIHQGTASGSGGANHLYDMQMFVNPVDSTTQGYLFNGAIVALKVSVAAGFAIAPALHTHTVRIMRDICGIPLGTDQLLQKHLIMGDSELNSASVLHNTNVASPWDYENTTEGKWTATNGNGRNDGGAHREGTPMRKHPTAGTGNIIKGVASEIIKDLTGMGKTLGSIGKHLLGSKKDWKDAMMEFAGAGPRGSQVTKAKGNILRQIGVDVGGALAGLFSSKGFGLLAVRQHEVFAQRGWIEYSPCVPKKPRHMLEFGERLTNRYGSDLGTPLPQLVFDSLLLKLDTKRLADDKAAFMRSQKEDSEDPSAKEAKGHDSDTDLLIGYEQVARKEPATKSSK